MQRKALTSICLGLIKLWVQGTPKDMIGFQSFVSLGEIYQIPFQIECWSATEM